jgi:hypothetical protein
MNAYDFDLQITQNVPRRSGGGSWVSGTIDGRYRFDGLVFAEHADSPDYELERSRISKLWIRDTATKKTVFNFDRGLDIPAADADTAAIVGFLCEGLADLIHG